MNRILYHIFLVILLVSSCSYPVDQLPETEAKILVQCEFTPGQDMNLYVYKGVGLPAAGSVPEIPDAIEIKLFSEFEFYEIKKIGGQLPFFRVDLDGVEGQRFDLSIKMPDEDVLPVSASSTIPRATKMKNISFSNMGEFVLDDRRISQIMLNFNLEDSNKEKYYELIIDRVRLARIIEPVDTFWHEINHEYDKVLFDQSTDLDESIIWLNDRRSFLIDYHALDDTNIAIPFKLDSPISDQLSLLRLSLKTHTKEGYDFIKSYEKTKLNYQSEFPILISNIENGIGVFSAFSQKINELVVPHE